MISEQQHINTIKACLSLLRTYVEINNSARFFDVNILAENFYGKLLKLIFGYDLVNTNISKKNSEVVDLIDHKSRVCVQVTSDSTSTKIRETLNDFDENTDFADCKRLVFFIITSKVKSRTKFSSKHVNFDKKRDIVALGDLVEHIGALDLSKIIEISEFLENSTIPFSNVISGSGSQASEVETIMDLIKHISELPGVVDLEKDLDEKLPNPNKKINERFADFSEYLLEEYRELYSAYQDKLLESYKMAGFDSVRACKHRVFLKHVSNDSLEKNENNPVSALKDMTQFFYKQLGESGIKYDYSAIRYFLIAELVKCNVFPEPMWEKKK